MLFSLSFQDHVLWGFKLIEKINWRVFLAFSDWVIVISKGKRKGINSVERCFNNFYLSPFE